MQKAALFWSGGKDSAYALYLLKDHPDLQVETLVTTLTEDFDRISMHGVREELLDLQAEAVDLPLNKMWVSQNSDNQTYELAFAQTLRALKGRGIAVVVFGDIFLEDLRLYREKLVREAGLTCLFPLWNSDTSALITEFLQAGFRTVTCCVSTGFLSEDYVGKEITPEFLSALPGGIDPCGEHGEFHTFCFDGPVFKKPVRFSFGEVRYTPLTIRSTELQEELGFWFVDLLPLG